MARASKASTKTEVVETTTSTVPTETITASAGAAKAPKQKKAKAPKEEVVAAPATEQVVASSTSGEEPAVAESETPLAEQSMEFLAKLQHLGVVISTLKTEYRNLEKKWSRELKTAQKQSSKRKRKAGNRAPSGFVKPTRISDELASFLVKPSGTEMARTDVTREINGYIRTNNLQDKQNGRKINPDAKLAALLKLTKDDELTYFNLQRFMSPHFSKAVKAEVAAVIA